jgi:hypothetical protein
MSEFAESCSGCQSAPSTSKKKREPKDVALWIRLMNQLLTLGERGWVASRTHRGKSNSAF